MFLRRILARGMGSALMAKVKESTGIVGLEVVPNDREVLISLYTKTLQEIKAVPENEGYRKAVESFTSHRLKVCQEEEDWERIEKRIGCGQVEELIEEAQDELKLIDKMIGYRKVVESFTNCGLKLCLEEEDWVQIEKRIGCGQIEELIRDSQDELKLIDKMIEWDPWGVPDDYECEVIEDDSPIPKHVPHHRSPPLPEEFHRTLEAITSNPAPKDEASPETTA